MNHTYSLLKASAEQHQWTPDLQLLILGNYMTRIFEDIDPEIFTDATAEYVAKANIPIELLIQTFCIIVDKSFKAEELKDINPFTLYLAGVCKEYEKEISQAAGAPEQGDIASTSRNEPAQGLQEAQQDGIAEEESAGAETIDIRYRLDQEVAAHIGKLLAANPPDKALGELLYEGRIQDPNDKNLVLHLNVMVAHPTPALDIYGTYDGGNIINVPPLRSHQWNNTKRVVHTQGRVRLELGFGPE